MMELVQLSDNRRDRERLRHFYSTIFVREFPDPDERESLENLEAYLAPPGTSARRHHIILALDGETPLAGSISDYFEASATAAIEFLVVEPRFWGHGIGTKLVQSTETAIAGAAALLGRGVEFIAIEINDPYKFSAIKDNVDPFARLRFWEQRGYSKLDFPYLQPAFSARQQPVKHLLLAIKTFGLIRAHLRADAVENFLRDYLTHAMQISEPETSSEFRRMVAYFDQHPIVGRVPLSAYIGEDIARPFVVHEVEAADGQAFAQAMAVYRTAFPAAATAIDEDGFRRAIAGRTQDGSGRYHLWALSVTTSAAISGMASFFALPAAGFGGYVAFAAPMRGTGRLRPLLARIETQLRKDQPAVRGWYIECADRSTVDLFSRHGFCEVPVRYGQPGLAAGVAGPELRLLYKELGAVYGAPDVSVDEFLAALADILRSVYGVAAPREHPTFQQVRRQLADRGTASIPFRPPAGGGTTLHGSSVGAKFQRPTAVRRRR